MTGANARVEATLKKAGIIALVGRANVHAQLAEAPAAGLASDAPDTAKDDAPPRPDIGGADRG